MKLIVICTSAIMLMLSTVPSQAQTKDINVKTEDNVIGSRITLHSAILDEQRELQVYLPKSYGEGDKKYPTLYILDGQYLFLNGVAASQTLADRFNMMPEIIVVGITTNSPERRSNLTGTKFLDFLESEVLTYVDATYRTSGERIIFGWQHAGTLIVQSIINKPDLFTGHIIADPFPLGGEGEDTRVKQLEQKLNPEFKGHLYFGDAGRGGMVADGTNELALILEEKAPKSFKWKHMVLKDEEHRTAAAPILPLGLRHYFDNYSDLYLPTLDAYIKAGGLDYVRAYYKTRSERYGFPPELPASSIWSLLSRSLIADNFEYFKMFMDEFRPNGLVRDARLRDVIRYAEFFVKYKSYNEALSLYGEAKEVHKNSSRVFHGMGKVYQMQDDRENAAIHYQKAIAIAKAANGAELAEYEKSLASLSDE